MAARTPNPCLGATREPQDYPTTWFGVREPFVPSNTQLTRYAEHYQQTCVKNYQKHPPAITFDGAALRVMRKRYPQDPLYQIIDEYRELEKCLGTYVRGMAPGADGRYREEFRHTPKTLRLAMKLLQLLPRVDELEPESVYNQIRGLVVASPGSVLLARDFSGIEAVMVAYLANDAQMYRLAGEVQGMHDFVATHAVGQAPDLAWSDADLKAYFATFKKENRLWTTSSGQRMPYTMIRTGCKRAVFLSFYGGTPPTMVQKEPALFPTRQVATWYQRLVFGAFPSIQRWQRQTCEEAETLGYVTAPGGFRLWYPDGVFDYAFNKTTKKWEKTLGQVAKECLAAKPQHLGMLFSARALVRAEADYLVRTTLRLSIHDEILCEVEAGSVDEVRARLKVAMEVPMPELPLPASWGRGASVRVQTEAKQGLRWSEMQ